MPSTSTSSAALLAAIDTELSIAALASVLSVFLARLGHRMITTSALQLITSVLLWSVSHNGAAEVRCVCSVSGHVGLTFTRIRAARVALADDRNVCVVRVLMARARQDCLRALKLPL